MIEIEERKSKKPRLSRVAAVIAAGGAARWAQIHWHEAHSLGRKEWKIKRFLD